MPLDDITAGGIEAMAAIIGASANAALNVAGDPKSLSIRQAIAAGTVSTPTADGYFDDTDTWVISAGIGIGAGLLH